MKSLSAALAAHLAQETTTLAELILITRTDGVVVGLAAHDQDLTVGGVTYCADAGFTSGLFENSAESQAKASSFSGFLESAVLCAADIEAGRYDHARVDYALCNWADTSQGVLLLRRGWLGVVTLKDGAYEAELRGFHDLLQRKVGDVYTPECRFELGDSRCGATCATVTGTVTAVSDAQTFSDTNNGKASGFFDYGILTWTSGANKGLQMEVKSWDGSALTLWLPMPSVMAVGDAYSVTAGCDKKFTTCKSKFDNAAAFGGFPHLPGLAKILQYPESS